MTDSDHRKFNFTHQLRALRFELERDINSIKSDMSKQQDKMDKIVGLLITTMAMSGLALIVLLL